MEMIKEGAGEDFLQRDFQAGRLGFLEDMHDLQGFTFFKEEIVFPTRDTFEAIDFSYGSFWHTKMTNAFFYCTMHFAKFYNCTFEKCTFHFNNCYASTFEKVTFVDCDFVENNSFTNCSFTESKFCNTFLSNNVFYDCKFDAKTSVDPPPRNAVATTFKGQLDNSLISDIYRGISEAYKAGGAMHKARKHLFLQLHFSTRYNSESFPERVSGLLFEYLTGHGLRPFRVTIAILAYFVIALCLFLTQVSFRDALLLTCGGLFTFGAKTDLLNTMGLFYLFLYIFSAFVGISLTALFITVLANVLIRER